MVLAALDGQMVEEIAVRLRLSRNMVYLWPHRFEQRGLAGLEDHRCDGLPLIYPGEQMGEIAETTLTKPPDVRLTLRLVDP